MRFSLPLLATAGMLLGACAQDDLLHELHPVQRTADEGCLDFESIAPGSIVSSVTLDGLPVAVHGYNPAFPADNAAMIFDSANPTGGDPDLGTPNQVFGGPGIGVGGEGGAYVNDVALGHLLIVSEDLDGSDPDDAALVGVYMEFDFSAVGTVTADAINIVDVDGESAGAEVRMFNAGGTLLASVGLPETGDNGVAHLSLGGVSGVSRIRVLLNGSGAINGLCVTRDVVEPGCTRTIGYWKNHTGFGPQDDEVTALLPLDLGSAGGSATLAVTDAATARDVLKQNVYGKPNNGITKLYAQLLAAKLNVAAGADASAVSAEMAAADAFLAANDHTAWNALSSADRTQVLAWKDHFDAYNNGLIGPGHCD